MSKDLDCRGLACPGPVLAAKKLVDAENPETLSVTVDNAAAKENVSRFLASQGFNVSVDERDGAFRVTGSRSACAPCSVFMPEPKIPGAGQKILVLAAADRIGRGDDELGGKLMLNFIKTLKEMGPDLWRVVLVNSGVKLAVTGSPALADLAELAAAGVTVLVCGTCLNHFNLLEKKEVGETTNMLDIVTSMQVADKVVSV